MLKGIFMKGMSMLNDIGIDKGIGLDKGTFKKEMGNEAIDGGIESDEVVEVSEEGCAS